MARMKIEFLHHYRRRHGMTLGEKLTAYLPRYGPIASRMAPLINARNGSPALAAIGERLTGMSRRRQLPAWRGSARYRTPAPRPANGAREVLLFVDCFARYFEPEIPIAARQVLETGGYRVVEDTSSRPLCCGRTFLSAGLLPQAREEMARLVAALAPHAERGVPIVGMEPSCILTLRDELSYVLDDPRTALLKKQGVLFEELVVRDAKSGALKLPFRSGETKDAYLHGHCHQKALGTMQDVTSALQLVPGLNVKPIESSCCGMAGAFGYEEKHYEVSMAMAERALLPAVRKAPKDALIVADGTSCRHQIADGAGRGALHVARVLASMLAD
jgi:Fe-S oxidoreductase